MHIQIPMWFDKEVEGLWVATAYSLNPNLLWAVLQYHTNYAILVDTTDDNPQELFKFHVEVLQNNKQYHTIEEDPGVASRLIFGVHVTTILDALAPMVEEYYCKTRNSYLHYKRK